MEPRHIQTDKRQIVEKKRERETIIERVSKKMTL